MKTTKTLPQNREFFNEHGASLAAYGAIGALGQLLSGLSLAYAVYRLLLAQIGAAGPADGTVLLILAAFGCGLFIELSNRVLAKRAIKPFVVKDLFAAGSDEAKRHKILNRTYLFGLVVVGMLSYVLSIAGSNYTAQDLAPDPELVDRDSIELAFAERIAGADQSFRADTLALFAPFGERRSAAVTSFRADSAALMKERAALYGCMQRGNKYCRAKRGRLLKEIDERRSVLADSIAAIGREKAAILGNLLSDRKAIAAKLDAERSSRLSVADETNRTRMRESESDTGFKSLIFVLLTVTGQSVFYLMVYLQLQVKAGSEIEEEIEPNEFWTLPPVVTEFWTTAGWRIERGARRLIRAVFGEPGPHETAIPYASAYAAATATAGDTDDGRNDDDGDDDDGDPDGDPDGGARRTNGRRYTRARDGEKNGCPVDEKRRRPKGKRRTPADGELGSLRACDQCSEDYVLTTHNKRFCSTDCKREWHAARNGGVAFDPKLHKYKRKA